MKLLALMVLIWGILAKLADSACIAVDDTFNDGELKPLI